MIHLKEFATQAEYEAFVGGSSLVRPNVSFVKETASVHYTDLLKPGIYIMHKDGALYTADKWTELGFAKADSFGVAVINPKASFVIDKYDGRQLIMLTSPMLVEGVTVTQNKEQAIADMNGVANTNALFASGISTAVNFVMENEYLVTPTGERGYIPSAGEWNIALSNRTEINTVLNLIGGDRINFSYWTSTQYSESTVWAVGSYGTALGGYSIGSTTIYARPFYPL